MFRGQPLKLARRRILKSTDLLAVDFSASANESAEEGGTETAVLDGLLRGWEDGFEILDLEETRGEAVGCFTGTPAVKDRIIRGCWGV